MVMYQMRSTPMSSLSRCAWPGLPQMGTPCPWGLQAMGVACINIQDPQSPSMTSYSHCIHVYTHLIDSLKFEEIFHVECT
jgi:hypothetical protein